MDTNVSFGQYLNGDSWIYKLDPRFKIISVVVLMFVLFMFPSIHYIIGALCFLLLLLISAKLPILKILRGLKPIILISTFTFVLQAFYGRTGSLLYTLNFNISILNIIISVLLVLIYIFTNKYIRFKLLFLFLILIAILSIFLLIDYNSFNVFNFGLYSDGLINGSFFVLRLITIVIITSLLTLTTSTIDLNTGLERILKPFKFIIPTSELALMISLTLRFVPTLLLETNKILKAQASRGVDFSEGSLIQKVRQISTLLIPMFVVSFKRADDLACAMESRGYVIGNERTSLNVLKFKAIDCFGFIFLFCSLIFVLIIKVYL